MTFESALRSSERWWNFEKLEKRSMKILVKGAFKIGH